MKTILTFSLLVLILSLGCNKTTTQTETKPTPTTATTTPEPEESLDPPLVEPLVPKVDPPEVPTQAPELTIPESTMPESTMPESTMPESTAPETTGIGSTILEKYTAEVVSLPPVDDLTAQVDEYVAKIGMNIEVLDGSTRYANDAADIVRDANALALVALAIGLSEADSKYKKSVPNIITAANNLTVAQNLSQGQQAYAELKAALTSTSENTSLAWSSKHAHLTPLMKAVPNLNSMVKRLTNTERKLKTQLERKPVQIYGALSALAAISQGSIANADETTKPKAAAEWKKLCEEFRDVAIKANVTAHQFAEQKADYEAFKNALAAISVSCDHCHEVFYPNAVGQN